MTLNNQTHLIITPIKPALIQGMAQTLQALVRIQAPEPELAPSSKRKPYHLALTIDRSGSMSGEPLHEALQCAKYIVDRLDANDHAALIVFDDRVKTLIPARPIGDRKAFYTALAQVESGGATNLYGGWQAGVNAILPTVKHSALARVLLLSDGNANVGDTTETIEIAAFCAVVVEEGVSTSTYGLGRDFNEELMIEMAKRGGGNHYYGDNAADLYEPFAAEFDLIANLFARQLNLTLRVPEGVKVKLLNDYVFEQRAYDISISLPDLPLGAEAWALVELEIPAHLALESGCELLQASISARSPEGYELNFADQRLALNTLSPNAWEVLIQDPLVLARQAELAAGIFLTQLRQITEYEDWETIQKMINTGRQRFADHPWVIDVLDSMANLADSKDVSRFRKEAMYSSRRMTSRLSAKHEDIKYCRTSELDSASFLRRKPLQGKAIFEQRPEDDFI